MKDTMIGCLRVAVLLWMLCTMISGCGPSSQSSLSPQQANDLNARLAGVGFPITYDGPMMGTSGYLSGREGIILFDEKNAVQTQQSAETVKHVVGDFLNRNGITGISFITIMGSGAKTRTIDLEPPATTVTPAPPGEKAQPGVATPTSPGTSSRHYSSVPISFDYPSYMTVPDKKKFDVEKIRRKGDATL